jgi:polar amino acid transport system permease protein
MDPFWATFHNPQLWLGLLVTLQLFAIVGVLGPVAGLITAILRDSRIPVISQLMWVYVWVMRGTPTLLQLLFIYNVLPQFGIRLSSFATAVIGLAIHEGATMGEIFRGGIHSVERDQLLAGRALGMRSFSIFRIIVLPQALRSIIPPMGTAYISLIKNTSLASVVGLSDMLGRSEAMAAKDYNYLEVYAAVGVMYLALSAMISLLQDEARRVLDGGNGRYGCMSASSTGAARGS